MIQVIRRLQFCAGHRVVGHEGKCKHPHGHNYTVLLHARSTGENELDDIGRVIDFGVLKDKVGGWIETNWDHAFIVWQDDKVLYDALMDIGAKVFPLPVNPTAEDIASFLLHMVCPMLIDSPVEVFQVVVHETDNCTAIAKLED